MTKRQKKDLIFNLNCMSTAMDADQKSSEITHLASRIERNCGPPKETSTHVVC